MVKVELLTREKFNEFYDVFTLLMNEGYEGFSEALKKHFLASDYSKFTYSYWLEKNFRRFSIAIDDTTGKVIGFLVGDNTYGGVGFISWVGILPEYRSKGVGKLLMDDYETFAKIKRAHLLELFTYDKVKTFYEKLGFKEIGRREHGFYGSKNIIMDKKIGDWNDDMLIKKEI